MVIFLSNLMTKWTNEIHEEEEKYSWRNYEFTPMMVLFLCKNGKLKKGKNFRMMIILFVHSIIFGKNNYFFRISSIHRSCSARLYVRAFVSIIPRFLASCCPSAHSSSDAILYIQARPSDLRSGFIQVKRSSI